MAEQSDQPELSLNRTVSYSPTDVDVSKHPFVDRFGRKIIDQSFMFSFKDGEIVLRAWIKKAIGTKEDNNYKEEFVSAAVEDVPHGWHHRKDTDFFYTANKQNLITIIYAKLANPKLKFTDSMCIYVRRKLNESKEMAEGFDRVKHLTLSDEEAIKALPDLTEKRTPDFLHQKIACQYAYYLPQCGILEEQGLGKTKTAIETFVAKKEAGLVDKCLVMGPLSVINRNGWGRQIKAYAPEDYTKIFVRGTKEEKQNILSGNMPEYDFYLINYEGLDNVMDELLSWVDDRTMLVADESSKIKNFYAKRTKHVIALGQLTTHKLILTGTPITQNAYDIFSQFYFLDNGDSFGTSYERFLERYFKKVGFKYVASIQSLSEIHDIIFDKSIRFTKDVLTDLPPKTYSIREVIMGKKQAEFYQAILKQEMIRLANLERLDANNVLTTILRLQQITSGFIKPYDQNRNILAERAITDMQVDDEGVLQPIETKNPKLDELMDILEEIGEAPAVIWTRFKYDVRVIAEELRKEGISFTTYIGGMNERQREQAEARFLDGSVRIFLSIPSAGGFGMNLQRASYSIYYCNDYSLQNRLQSEDRVHRMGQKGNVSIIDICCKGTIDMQVLDVLLNKKEIADMVTGDTWRNFLQYNPDDDEDC